jgi:glycosyltransferase involved in cell wall biosynthesis
LGLFDKKLKNSYLNTYNSVDAFGVLCDSYSQEFAEKLGIDNTSSKFVTLTNAAYPKTTNGDVNKRKEVCFVGRLSYADKRVDRLLQAWRLLQDKHKDWVLNIVGDGQEMNSLKRLADELGLKRVCFKGFTTTPEIYYNSASIVCLTSTTEGWPMTLIEAQANGCATIAFDCSAGVREILSPGRHTPRSPYTKPFIPCGVDFPPTSKQLVESSWPPLIFIYVIDSPLEAVTINGLPSALKSAKP